LPNLIFGTHSFLTTNSAGHHFTVRDSCIAAVGSGATYALPFLPKTTSVRSLRRRRPRVCASARNLTQVWFPGVHCDVGGAAQNEIADSLRLGLNGCFYLESCRI
jgi:hypothetical protein